MDNEELISDEQDSPPGNQASMRNLSILNAREKLSNILVKTLMNND